MSYNIKYFHNMPEEILDVSSQVEYQKDSIVSKEILKGPTGTVTVFAFDKGQGLSEHTAPFDALIQVIDGTAEIKIATEKHIVNQGQMLIAPAGKAHELKANERFKMMLIMLKA